MRAATAGEAGLFPRALRRGSRLSSKLRFKQCVHNTFMHPPLASHLRWYRHSSIRAAQYHQIFSRTRSPLLPAVPNLADDSPRARQQLCLQIPSIFLSVFRSWKPLAAFKTIVHVIRDLALVNKSWNRFVQWNCLDEQCLDPTCPVHRRKSDTDDARLVVSSVGSAWRLHGLLIAFPHSCMLMMMFAVKSVVALLTLLLSMCLAVPVRTGAFHVHPLRTSAPASSAGRCSVEIGWLWIDTASFRCVRFATLLVIP